LDPPSSPSVMLNCARRATFEFRSRVQEVRDVGAAST
jgi:hypothetical protein